MGYSGKQAREANMTRRTITIGRHMDMKVWRKGTERAKRVFEVTWHYVRQSAAWGRRNPGAAMQITGLGMVTGLIVLAIFAAVIAYPALVLIIAPTFLIIAGNIIQGCGKAPTGRRDAP